MWGKLDESNGSQLLAEFLKYDHTLKEGLVVQPEGRWHRGHGWVVEACAQHGSLMSWLDPVARHPPDLRHPLPSVTYCSPGTWPISCLRTRSSLPGNWGTL